jgi:beta-lactamase class C
VTRILSVIVFLAVIFISYLAFTDIEPAPETSESVSDEWVMDEALASYLQDFERTFTEGMNENKIPGAAVAMVKDGRIVFQKGFGVREKGKPQRVDEHTVFRLGSVSKGFASVLTAVLADEGVVDWDDPVSGYLEDFRLYDPGQTRRVQIRHLLSHTSGLPRHSYTNLVEDGLSLDRIIPRLQEVPLIAKEGEQLAYQNATYSVIEKVLESQTENDFNTLLQEKLFDPLSMENASSTYEGIHEADNKALPHVYVSRSRGRAPISISRKYYNAVSSGGINASASDMGKWLLMLTGHHPEVISEESLNTLSEPIATLNNRRFSRHWDDVNRSYYGLGWRILDNHGQKIVYHGGYVNGYRSEIAFSPDDGTGICILINTSSSYPLEVIPGFFNHFKSDSPDTASDQTR